MIKATRIIEFDAGHRLLRHESKCAHIHGHRYKAEIHCEAPELDAVGRVIDFSVIKELVGSWVDEEWDHAFLVNVKDQVMWRFLDEQRQKHYVMPCEPTAENMAAHLLEQARHLLKDKGVRVVLVRLWETPNCFAEAK